MLHIFGLGLLWLSGKWTPLSGSGGGGGGGGGGGVFPLAVLDINLIDKMLLLTVVLYILAATTDPGYVQLPADTEDGKPLPTPQQPQLLQAPLLELPQCVHCSARQPARTKHCHDCGRCVRRLDHHCWWLGSCVGAGNHRLFLAYLVMETCLVCTAAASAAGLPVDRAAAAAAASPLPAGTPFSTLAGVAGTCCLAMCLVLGLLALTLLGFQCALIARGETTWEHLRRERLNAEAQRPPFARPYDRGVCRNCVDFALARTPHAPIAPAVAVASVPTAAVRRALVVGEATSEGDGATDATGARRVVVATQPPYGL